MPKPRVPKARKGQAKWPLPRGEVTRRVQAHFFDASFDANQEQIDRLADTAWSNYKASRKSPKTRRAGKSFADPVYELSVEWLATRDAVLQAARDYKKPGAAHVLLICASSRNDKTCPGEMSKTFRIASAAQRELLRQKCAVDFLDLSVLTSEFQRVIYPCKACVSTAMPLCHWPCSCYPNHALGQVNDWMSEIYPRWVRAHGILIVTPVYWYQVPSSLKSMMDRLVCADGGNPDPTSTHGKNVAEAKELELKGWSYPRHLAGRAYGVIAHGDAEGADTVRRSLCDWLNDMQLVSAGPQATIDRYVGYYRPYATSHLDLDKDQTIFEETRNVARNLANRIRALRREPQKALLAEPRPK